MATDYPSAAVLVALCLAPAILHVSWTAFWFGSLLILTYSVFRKVTSDAVVASEPGPRNGWESPTVLSLAASAVVLTLAVSRSDLDDAFYVAVSAFTSGHPSEPLLAFDPMHGDRNLPLIFPSYRFSSFELLAGALANLLGIPAMDVVYKVLPPLWAVTTVFCIFLLAQELMPKRWLVLGVIAFLLIVILGESHRGPANMMFVRMFQGKAVYLSAIVPAIFYLTGRYLSPKGRAGDLFLLGCAQLTAIGMSNFAMLAAPMAGFGALLSNALLIEKESRKKLWGGLMTLAIPLPYLIMVAVESHGGSSLLHFQIEKPFQVWESVFGPRQQYVVAILLLAGPVLARDALTRHRLAIPPLILFAIYLNPYLSDFISKNITTPPVYWRVVWSFPILIFAAASACTILDRLMESQKLRSFPAFLSAIVFALLGLSLPYHTLRSDNIGFHLDFASRKVPAHQYAVAESAIRVNGQGNRLLAPDEISGVISRFEEHPKLVSVRSLYIDLLASALGKEAYRDRSVLHGLVSGSPARDIETTRAALNSLRVATIVMLDNKENEASAQLLEGERYRRAEIVNGYVIWSRHE
jgi:hypothetical protein